MSGVESDLEQEKRLYDVAEVARKWRGWKGGSVGDVIAAYGREGFVAIDGAFDMAQVEAARAGLRALVGGECAGFDNIEFEKHAADVAKMPLEARFDYVRKLMGFVGYEKRLAAMAEDAKLMELIGAILGARPKLLQDMALLKPGRGREKPWHQDNAYFDVPMGTKVVGVWIALDEATPENGCMHLLPGEHGRAVVHFKRRDWQICDTEIVGRKCVAVPLSPGGCLVFDGMLPHGTPTNRTNQRRRALQFHYVAEGTPRVDSAERLAVFGSEGKDVSC